MNLFKSKKTIHNSDDSIGNSIASVSYGVISDLIHNCPSAPMKYSLEKTKNIDDFLKQYKHNMAKLPLQEYLNFLLVQNNLNVADVVRGSQLNRTYVYDIFNGKKRPSRDTLIALAFGLRLSEDETWRLLKLSGNRALYVKDERDVLIWFSLRENKDILETNELLYKHHFEPLGSPVE